MRCGGSLVVGIEVAELELDAIGVLGGEMGDGARVPVDAFEAPCPRSTR
jgi:hypothetical protein